MSEQKKIEKNPPVIHFHVFIHSQYVQSYFVASLPGYQSSGHWIFGHRFFCLLPPTGCCFYNSFYSHLGILSLVLFYLDFIGWSWTFIRSRWHLFRWIAFLVLCAKILKFGGTRRAATHFNASLLQRVFMFFVCHTVDYSPRNRECCGRNVFLVSLGLWCSRLCCYFVLDLFSTSSVIHIRSNVFWLKFISGIALPVILVCVSMLRMSLVVHRSNLNDILFCTTSPNIDVRVLH